MKQLTGLALGGVFKRDISDPEAIHIYKEAGLESFFSGMRDDTELDAIRAAADRSGMVWTSIHAPYNHVCDLWHDDPDKANAELEVQFAAIDAAARFGVPLVVIHPFIGFQEHSPNAVGLENYRRILDRAAEKGVLAAIENVEGTEYLDCLMTGLKGHPALRFCLDTGHEMCYNGGQDLLAKYGDQLAYLHINSNEGSFCRPGDPHTWHDDAHLLPYDGVADMHRLAANLARLGSSCPLTMELSRFNKPGRHTHDGYLAMTDEEYLAEAVKRIHRLQHDIAAAASRR